MSVSGEDIKSVSRNVQFLGSIRSVSGDVQYLEWISQMS